MEKPLYSVQIKKTQRGVYAYLIRSDQKKPLIGRSFTSKTETSEIYQWALSHLAVI